MPTLDWIGKKAVVQHHREVPVRLLKCDPDRSAGDPDAGNLIVQGDNLKALKALLPFYAGKVKCVYIDPPYNTGNEGWIYNDNVNAPEVKDWLGSVVGKEAEDLSRHDKWLCMMYPRLRLLREFLAEDGFIAIQIDENEQAHLRLLLDEIFGASNWLNTIAVKMSETSGVKMSHVESRLPKLKEYVNIYSRSPSQSINPIRTLKDDEKLGKYLKYYTKFIMNPDASPQNWRVIDVRGAMTYAGLQPHIEEDYRQFQLDNADRVVYRTSNAWIARQKQSFDIEEMESPTGIRYIAWEGKQMLFLKDYVEEYLGDLWLDISTINLNKEGGVDFENGKKPLSLLKRVLSVFADSDSLILDSFAGSGTTMHAAMQLNREDGGSRRCILVEMEEHIATEVTSERIRRVMQQEDAVEGEGFRYCTLGEPLFDGAGQIRGEVTYADLAHHVFFSETGRPLPPGEEAKRGPRLGEHDGRALYLLYNGVLGDRAAGGGNVLTRATLQACGGEDAGTPRVVYAAGCRLGEATLRRAGVTFRQLPYDLKLN